MSTKTQHTAKYKNSSLGLIPEDWEVKRLGELGEFKNGINKDKEDFGFGFPMVNLMDVFGVNKVFKNNLNLTLVNANERDIRDFSLKMGDVLFIRSSVKPTGVGLTTLICDDLENTTYSGFIIRFRDNDYFNLEFKAHCFYEEGFRQRLLNKSTISANTNINQVALKSLSIQIPPLSEQAAIAECLSTWDKAIEKLNGLIAQKELSKKALTQKLLTGKLRIKGFDNEKWVEMKADKIFRNNTDKTHNGELEILSASQERGILPRRLNNIDIKYDENSLGSYKKVEVGDYVISLRSFQGGIEYSEYEGIVSPAYTILKEIVPISKVFYKVYFKTETFINRLNTIIYGIRDGKQISFNDFATLKIPYPSIEEQNAIASVLQCADDELQLLKKKRDQLKEQKKGLLQVLLTGKKRLKY